MAFDGFFALWKVQAAPAKRPLADRESPVPLSTDASQRSRTLRCHPPFSRPRPETEQVPRLPYLLSFSGAIMCGSGRSNDLDVWAGDDVAALGLLRRWPVAICDLAHEPQARCLRRPL